METEALYDRDSHLRTFTACVTACEHDKDRYRVALDRTCFFPEGGGQAGDRGSLHMQGEEIPVTDTRRSGGVIWHTVCTPIPAGTQVEGILNWDLRFARMQCHSGEHIASGLFYRRHGLENVGFHLGDEEVTIDLNGPITWEQVQQVERLSNQAVALDLPVQISYPSPAELKTLTYRSKLDLTENVRIVTIPGYDVCACCAPHVSRTGEIGLIHFLSMQNYKGGVRLRMLCGSRAVEDVMAKQNSVTDISVRLSARQDRVSEAVLRLSSEAEQAKQRAARLERQVAQAKADALPPTPGRQIFFTDFDTEGLRTLVNAAIAKGAPLCAAFAPSGDRWQYILGAPERDLRPLVKEMNAALQGRGGGSAQMVQGSVQTGRDAISAWWDAYFSGEDDDGISI